MSLRTRLVLAAAYLLVVVVVALEVPLGRNIKDRLDSEFRTGVLVIGGLVASRISDDVARSGSDATIAPDPDPVISEVAARSAEGRGVRVLVVDPLGRVLADTSRRASVGDEYMSPERPEFEAVLLGRTGGEPDVRERPSDTLDEELLLVTVPIFHERQITGAVRVSVPTDEVQGRTFRIWIGLGLIGLGVVAVGLALAWVLAGSLVRPVTKLSEAAKRLGEGDLEARANPEGPGELASLARSFNQMAGALSANVAAQQDFFANASHQLRTPLTGLRLRLEAIEHEGGPAAEQATKAQGELDRLAKLVQDLLELTRASSTKTLGSPVELTEVARTAVDRWTGPVEAAGKRLRLELDGAAEVWADPADLDHIVDNLIENAIRYCPPGTEISVEAGDRGGVPTLAVADDGPGIPPADRHRIFERFYRGTNGRRAGPGTGLGLAIVQELAERWGGRVKLSNRQGTCVEATFPAGRTVP